jgi:DNA-binding LacI/PurR family transcriptional regulator/DNA-binding transcriptional regulator YhcF (GntR family)
MPSLRKTLPALRANEFISNALQRGKWPSDKQFVSIKRLADMAGVSLVTMWKAVADAREKALVDVVRRKGVCIRTAIEKKAEPQLQDMVCRNIERDIFSGVFLSGQRLPSRKELMQRYGVSHVTLGKALGALRDNALLVRAGRWYAAAPVVGTTTGMQSARITVIAGRNEIGLPQFGIKQSDTLHILERTAAQNGIALDIVTFSGTASSLLFNSFPSRKKYDIRKSGTTFGYVVFHVIEREKKYRQLFKTLCRTGHPVAIIDEIGMRPAEIPQSGLKQTNVFSVVESNRAVEQMVRYLLAKGHKGFAYISPFHAAPWSKKRLEALQQSLKQAGITAPVKTMTLDSFKSRLEIVDILKNETRSLQKVFAAWEKTVAPEYYSYSRELAEYESTYTLSKAYIRRQFDALLRPLLSDRSITACVAANDMTASILLDSLECKSIAVPGRISIASFDNETHARNRGITSYDFNLHGMMNAAIMSILRPEAYRRSNAGHISAIAGFIVERESTRQGH